MRLRQIEVFQAVYTNGSISGAARALHVSQPSVSKVLRHTETQLGLKLFDLVKGRLIATNEAHQLFKDVDDVYRRISSLSQFARNLKSSGYGQLKIGVVPSLGLDLVPKAMSEFNKSGKSIAFEIQTVEYKEILRGLYEREFDLVICYGPPPRHRLITKKIGSADLVVFAQKNVFETGRKKVSIRDLGGKSFVGYNSSGTIGEFISGAIEKEHLDVNQFATVGTYFIAAGIVRNCGGVTIVDELTARAMLDENTIVLELESESQFDLHVSWLEDRPPSQIAHAFISSLERILARQPTNP